MRRWQTTLCASVGMAQLMLNDTGRRLDRIRAVSYGEPRSHPNTFL
jgi:hypothetical protein